MDDFTENQLEQGEKLFKKQKKKREQKLWVSIVSLVLFVAFLLGAAAMWGAWGVQSVVKVVQSHPEEVSSQDAYYNDYDPVIKQLLQRVELVGLEPETQMDRLETVDSQFAMELSSMIAQAKQELNEYYSSTLYSVLNRETGTVVSNTPGTDPDAYLAERMGENNLIELNIEQGQVSVSYYDPDQMDGEISIYDRIEYSRYAIPQSSYFNEEQLRSACNTLESSLNTDDIGLFYRYVYGYSSVVKQYSIRIVVPPEAVDHNGTIRNCYHNYQDLLTVTPLDIWKIAGSSALSVSCLIFLILFLRNAKAFFCGIGRGLRWIFRQVARLAKWCGGWMNKITLEIKLGVLLLYLFVSVPFFDVRVWILDFYTFIAGILLFFVLVSDLAVNHLNVFRHNQIRSMMRRYRAFEKRKRFQQRIDLRFAFCCGGSAFGLVLMLVGTMGYVFGVVLLGLLILAVSVFFFYYLNYRSKEDIQKLIEMIEDMYNGNFQHGVWLPQESDMYVPSLWLNDIRDQVENEVENRIKSERMKVELITNVSHDLKTPLTSMINYIDLLQEEELSPEFANDYVKVLHRKINRLKTMVEDLFDVAKANSGNLEVTNETIELGELVEQTLGEDEAAISSAGLDFRVNTQSKVYVETDGPKMYRIVSNIVGNAVKYAMPGTRVYIDIAQSDHVASLTVKNISSYEMNFTAEEIMERFKRGEDSRSTEGSGLGLSIVQSFVSLLGGDFHVEIDGDLFKAVLRFHAADENQPSEKDTVND